MVGGLTLGLALAWLAIATGALVSGLDYYRADAAARAYSELRPLYAPTGVIGHSLGYAGAASIVVGVALYVVRKRWRRLERWGRLPDWLQVHIFLCTLGPYLVVLHSTFKYNGVAGISFWAMVAAVVSGIVGRYLYAQIPRTMHGTLRTLDALETEAAQLERGLGDVAPAVRATLDTILAGRPAPPRRLGHALWQAARFDWQRRVRLRRARRVLARAALGADERDRLLVLLRTRFALEQQIALLAPFQRLFHYWHVLHLPVALLMLLTLALHVALAIAFGYGWPF